MNSHPTRFLGKLLVGTISLLAYQFVAFTPVNGQVPETIAFQGFMVDSGGNPADTMITIVATLYDSLGVPVWTETHPSAAVDSGVFNIELGSIESLAGVAFVESFDLGIKLGGDAEISPKSKLSSSPYALGLRGIRIYPVSTPDDAPNIVGGHLLNSVGSGTVGAFIGGGGRLSGVTDEGNTIGVDKDYSVVVGGYDNTAGGTRSVIVGGNDNTALSPETAIVGGSNNSAGGTAAFIGGGRLNRTTKLGAVVPGGEQNHARGQDSFAGGFGARAAHDYSFVWNSRPESDPLDTLVTTSTRQFLIRADSGVGIGTNTPGSPLTVAGRIESTTGGFKFPDGTTQTSAATSGAGWSMTGDAGTSVATNFLGTTDTAAFDIRVGNYRALRFDPVDNATDGPNLIAGHRLNSYTAGIVGATIGGGGQHTGSIDRTNKVQADYATIGGGRENVASDDGATVGGGYDNLSDGNQSTVGGGNGNSATGTGATVGGGSGNHATANYATVAGGNGNTASALRAAVGGGNSNVASGQDAVVPGGFVNAARGVMSFAGGYRAKANHDGSFVWNDYEEQGVNDTLSTTGPNQFIIDAGGGVGIGKNDPASPLDVNGQITADSMYVDGRVYAKFLVGLETRAQDTLFFGSGFAGQSSLFFTGPNHLEFDGGVFAPFLDDSTSLGNSVKRWKIVWAANGTINTSDARYKTDIRDLDYSLKQVMSLRPVRFKWKDHPTEGDRLGLIAQEVRPLVPEVVWEDNEEGSDRLGLSYSSLIPVLINAIQEQEKHIEQLEAALKTAGIDLQMAAATH